jgi:putative (di)nucleoside polyphosphate hydrolase
MLLDKHKNIWAGERIDHKGSFQMPQGGIDAGEALYDAAFRELYEETGIQKDQVTIIAETTDWFTVMWPEYVLAKFDGPYNGVSAKWILMQMVSDEDTTDLTRHIPEFTSHKWAPFESVIDMGADFKRDLYQYVHDEFARYVYD